MVTDFLFAKPNFVRGAGSAIDLLGKKYYNESINEDEADARAIFSDWCMIGKDLSEAMNVGRR
ncbi:hypothetical protein IJH46_01250 [Candidatus Saccharibacteria bacterium]|nr:hypothetical protein [Candidatus Saccharibacteria bacterium]